MTYSASSSDNRLGVGKEHTIEQNSGHDHIVKILIGGNQSKTFQT
jgi:hypothetical protein